MKQKEFSLLAEKFSKKVSAIVTRVFSDIKNAEITHTSIAHSTKGNPEKQFKEDLKRTAMMVRAARLLCG